MVNRDGYKLNGIYQLLAYADDDNILGERLHNVKKSTEALVVATKEIGLVVNADKLEYMFMAIYKNGGRKCNIKFQYISVKGGRSYIFGNNVKDMKFYSKKGSKSFGAEYFVFEIATKQYKDIKKQNYNFVCCFVWVSLLEAYSEGQT